MLAYFSIVYERLIFLSWLNGNFGSTCGYHYIFTLVRFETESIDKMKTAGTARNQEHD